MAAVLLVALTWPPTATAQIGSAVVEGRIEDAAGTPLPAVSVGLRNEETGLVRVTTSAANGVYRVPGLVPGRYELTLSRAGFTSETRKGLELAVGQVARIDVRLSPQLRAEETIEVLARAPLLEVTESQLDVLIDAQEIRNLPLNNRNVVELALQAPGVSAFRNTGSPEFSPINFAAQNNRATRLHLDGVDFGNDFLGGIYGTAASLISQNAVEQFEVVTSRFKPEYGQTAGGLINLVSRSGSNDFHGGVFGAFRDDELNATNHFEETKPPFERQQLGATLGGPITRDKSHFFLAFEHSRQDDFVVVNTNGLFPQEDGTFRSPFRNTSLLGKIDLQLGQRHWLTATYTDQDRARDEFFGGNVARSGGIRVPESVRSFSLQHRWVPTDRSFAESRAAYVRWRLETQPFDSGPRLIFPSAEVGRWPPGRQQLGEERVQLRHDHHYLVPDRRGEHNLKIGIDLADVRSSAFRVDFFGSGLFIFPFDGAPFAVLGVVGDGERNLPSIENQKLSLYVQDDWSPTSSLTLNLGLRYDVETNASNQDYTSTKSDPALPYIVRSDRDVDDDNLAPRVGFAWSTRLRGRGAVVRGGFGLFYGRLYATYPLGEIQSDGYRVTTLLFPPTTDIGELDLQGLPYRIEWLLPEEVEVPYTTQLSLGVAVELTDDMALEVDLVSARGYHEVFLRNDVNPIDPRTFQRPLPEYQEVLVARNDGRSFYDALQIVVRKRMSRNYQFRAAYTLSEAENDFDEQLFDSPGAFQRGPVRWDERHRLAIDGLVRLPHGLQLSGLFRWTSGRRFTVFTGVDANLNGDLTDDQPEGVGRNSERTDPFSTVDLRLAKLVDTKRFNVELMVDVFNLFNRTNFDPTSYIGNLRSPLFGQPTAALPARQVQLGARLNF